MKLLEIKDCKECPFYLPFTECIHPKFKKGRKLEISVFGKIPKWCPLSNAKGEKE